jgi:hypothetical protein
MSTNEHPITPPPELIEQWMQAHSTKYDLARQAAQWGADHELEECLKALDAAWDDPANSTVEELQQAIRAARRPKSLTLVEQTTAELDAAVMRGDCITTTDAMPLLRAALKRLAELEALPND